MPNHISNRLKISGTESGVAEVLDFIKDESQGIGSIDFNKITPMPRWVYGSSPDVFGISMEDEKRWGSENTVLDWSRRHWGTKWNAYSQSYDPKTEEIYFETAWSGIPDLIQKIAWIFPNVVIDYRYADEDTGSSNNGIYKFKYSDILEEKHYFSQSKEAYEMCFDLCYGGEQPSHYKYSKDTGTYEYWEEGE